MAESDGLGFGDDESKMETKPPPDRYSNSSLLTAAPPRMPKFFSSCKWLDKPRLSAAGH